MGQPVQEGLLQRVIEGAMNAVNVSSNDADGTTRQTAICKRRRWSCTFRSEM